MRPQLAPEFHFIQLRNADAIPIGGDMLRHNVHGHFAEKQVRTDPRRCRDASGRKHVENDLHGQIVGRQFVGV